jgi:hypothetical protein
LACCVSGQKGDDIDPAHIRFGTGGGTGLKPHDSFCVPLHHHEHIKQHQVGEIEYWGENLGAAIQLANDLWEVSGDDYEALLLIARFRLGIHNRQ